MNYDAEDIGSCKYRAFKKAFDNPFNYAEFRLLTELD